MACFLVPLVLAVITTLLQRASKDLAEKLKLSILNGLLWGGVVLLALEHVWHGEVVLWPPFLTAMANPANIPIMLHEMVTIGTAMSVVVVLAWSITMALINLVPRTVLAKELKRAERVAPAQP